MIIPYHSFCSEESNKLSRDFIEDILKSVLPNWRAVVLPYKFLSKKDGQSKAAISRFLLLVGIHKYGLTGKWNSVVSWVSVIVSWR